MQIRMAKPARDGADTHLGRVAVGYNDIFELQRLARLDQYSGFGHLKLTPLSARPDPVEGPFFLQEGRRSEEHTSELQSLMRISYAVFCLKKKIKNHTQRIKTLNTCKHTEIRPQPSSLEPLYYIVN